MTVDKYGVLNTHGGSEPSFEPDQERITDAAVALLDERWTCWCGYGATIADEVWEAGKRLHAETCDKLRERAIDWLYGGDYE